MFSLLLSICLRKKKEGKKFIPCLVKIDLQIITISEVETAKIVVMTANIFLEILSLFNLTLFYEQYSKRCIEKK